MENKRKIKITIFLVALILTYSYKDSIFVESYSKASAELSQKPSSQEQHKVSKELAKKIEEETYTEYFESYTPEEQVLLKKILHGEETALLEVNSLSNTDREYDDFKVRMKENMLITINTKEILLTSQDEEIILDFLDENTHN